MPKGYVIVTEAINDMDKMNEYAGKAFPSIIQYGANVLAVSDDVKTIEGTWHGTRTVVLEFESVEKAQEWYDSPEYGQARPLRWEAGESNAVILGGFG